MNDQEYCYLKQKSLVLTGIDLDCYKDQQMRRRLDGFMTSQSLSVVPYCETLRRDPTALRKLRDFLTINVSEFFRDKQHFETLKTVILPDLLRRNRRLNIWSAGCSHGAEAYSVAMLLDEISPGTAHRVLATDIDEKVLGIARHGGPYSASDVAGVESWRLLKYFSKSDGGYWIADRMRKQVEVRCLNLLGDPFESGFDLITCRNVVIYFTEVAKSNLIRKFHRALKSNGVLFMGASETLVVTPESEFERLGICFYQKRSSGTPEPAHCVAATARVRAGEA